MFNPALLKPEVQEYIRNYSGNVSNLAFRGSPFEDVSGLELMMQIESRSKTEKKLPSWFNSSNIIFPPKLNLEQTSSEITAKYKASLLKGETLADITGGFGVDCFYFADHFTKVFHFETNEELSAIAKHNFEIFGKKNIACAAEDGLEAILKGQYNAIYADPSRRHASKGKVFFLRDCQPNIPDNISEILDHCEVFLLKTSPMLDISVGLNELQNVSEIHIVAVENEVKELLWTMKKEAVEAPLITAVNLHKNGVDKFSFDWQQHSEAEYSLPQKYLFEPNAAILKSGAFDLISEKLKLHKLHQNTHLYTSDTLADFPGRRFVIDKTLPYSKSDMRSLNIKKANITTRNFPESVDVLRKKWKISDGGETYLFFLTALDNKKYVLLCSKLV